MRELLIRSDDDEWFDLPSEQWPVVMRPNSIQSRHAKGWGNHRIEVRGVEVAFSNEDAGIQVTIEGDLPEDLARRVVEEELQDIVRSTGRRGRIVAM